MDVLLLKERIEKTIELGESQFREFKSAMQGAPGAKAPREISAISKDIAETLVAFANADGGELLVGVEDDGTITGVPHTDDRIKVLLQAPVTGVLPETPLSSPIGAIITFDTKKVLYFYVDKSTRIIHQTSLGRCLQRRDLESVPVAATMLQFERREQISREYDRQFVDGAEVTDLEIDLIKSVSKHTTKLTPEKCLQYLGLAEYGSGTLRLRHAALLLFAKSIDRWHPRCQVRILRIPGTELKTGREYRVADDEVVTDNILRLLTHAWDRLRPHLVTIKLSEGALFREQVMYPEDACREALINALTHRDYSSEGKGVEIHIFDDRMEVHSPGSLLSTIKIDDLRRRQGVHDSRNAHIARVLRENGYVREMGEGMRRIFQLMQDADLIPPEIKSDPGGFAVTLFHRSVFSVADQAWLAGYRPLKLSREEMLVAMLGKEQQLISPRQIYDLLGLHDWDIYRTVFEQLAYKGVIFNTLTEAQKNMKRASSKPGKSNRDIPRLAIRQPDVLERALSDLFAAIARLSQVEFVDMKYCEALRASLPEDAVYNMPWVRLLQLLRTIGFIDSENTPTASMKELWKQHHKEVMSRSDLIAATALAPRMPIKGPSNTKNGEPDAIYVGNLGYEANAEGLKELFERQGRVIHVRIPVDHVTGKNRGFAFVTMADRQLAANVIATMQGQMFLERPLRLGWARF
jgi:ATP-dependent DNA helicase RecG